MDINQIQAQRQQNNASRLTGGKKFSVFTHDENQNSDNCMSPSGIPNGLMPQGKVMSAKDSDRSSIMDIPEQNDDLPSAYDVQKNRELKKLVVDDFANSGAGSTNKDSFCNVTSAKAPASLMDRVFSSELDNTPGTRKSRMTTFSLKHPPKILH